MERNLQDALNVARNLYQEPRLVPGGGATEMEVAHLLSQKAKGLNGVVQWPYKAIASALEVKDHHFLSDGYSSFVLFVTPR